MYEKRKRSLTNNNTEKTSLTTSISDGSNTKHSLGRLALLPVRFPKLKHTLHIHFKTKIRNIQ